MPALSRERMVEALKNGGSVLLDTATGPKHVTRLEDLPAESELAAGDAGRARAARQAVEGQMALLAREQQRLSDLERKATEDAARKAEETQKAEAQKAKAEESPAAQQPQKAEVPRPEPPKAEAVPAAPEKQAERQAEPGGEAERYEAARRGRGRG
jgi:membrane protein involved in colicin uptake